MIKDHHDNKLLSNTHYSTDPVLSKKELLNNWAFTTGLIMTKTEARTAADIHWEVASVIHSSESLTGIDWINSYNSTYLLPPFCRVINWQVHLVSNLVSWVLNVATELGSSRTGSLPPEPVPQSLHKTLIIFYATVNFHLLDGLQLKNTKRAHAIGEMW